MPVKGVSAFSVSPVRDVPCSIAEANGAGDRPRSYKKSSLRVDLVLRVARFVALEEAAWAMMWAISVLALQNKLMTDRSANLATR